MRKRTLLICAGALVAVVVIGGRGAVGGASPDPVPASASFNNRRIQALIDEMRHVALDKLPALEITARKLPEPGVDVMRVRLEETYDVAGIGKDTIDLSGWIAVRHDHTRPGEGETTLTWNTALTDTEFVAMELHGESPTFGPVAITLDPTMPSRGQVGRLCLPFVVGSSLDAAYLPYRKLFKADVDASNRIQGAPGPQYVRMLFASPRPTAGRVGEADRKSVMAAIDGVIKAIGDKDSKALLEHYSPAGNNLFFGQTKEGVTRGGENYVRQLSTVFANIKTIQVKRNDDVQLRVSGNLAVASLTGVNNVVNAAGKKGASPWRWTVELERTGGKWMISHDHLSFYNDPNMPVDHQELSGLAERGACCLANLSVSVVMQKLDLQMRTASPVRWYSEVETIPPVGHTASVSAIPTPLVSGGREVGTLIHGAVKFREVVRHVPLMDVTRPEMRVASLGSGDGR